VITGTLSKVAAGGTAIAVKTADGSVETIKFTEKTTVHWVKGADVTVDEVGKVAETVGVKAADVTKQTLSVADHATVDAGKDEGKYSFFGVKKGAHLTGYFTGEAGKGSIYAFERL
jgi:hypothetical protein